MLSTPYGKRGEFYEAWQNGGDSWERYMVPATEVSRITPEFFAEERRSLPEFVYRQGQIDARVQEAIVHALEPYSGFQ
jgi:hypothetical protein